MKKNFLSLLNLLIIGALGTTIAFAADKKTEYEYLPDSLITDNYVYEYTFSDFGKAEGIMQELRKRKKLPDFRLDMIEGDLYFNTGHYYRALKYYKRALNNDSVRLNDGRMMEQIHRMISCYDCLHNEAGKAQYVTMLLKKAKQCGDKAMHSIALFNMGKMLYYQGNKGKGYEYMQCGIDLMKKTSYKYRYDNLRYNYNTLLTFQKLDRRNKEALLTLEALQEVVTEQTGTETPIEGLGEKEKKAMYAHYAVVLSRLGQAKEAEEYYRCFLSTAKEYRRDDYLIMPYLFRNKRYDEVIRMNSDREKAFAMQADTVNYYMTTIKSSLGQAYEEKGDYRRAARYFRELAVLRDSIKNREQKSSVLELATIYETNEKDMLIQMQNANARIQNVWLGLAGCIAFFMAVILCFVVRHNRAILVKNRAMAGTIDDLLGYKDELFLRKEENLKLKEENLILNEQWQVVETEWIKWNQAVVVEEEIEEETEPRKRMHENTLNDRTLFDKAEYEIISRKLFLQPDFSRDELMKIVHIPKNKFARLFKQYAGVGFSQYINNLRLDHVARMLKEYPDYTVDGIVKESGILTRQTFYRLFSERFGMTPVEYQKAISTL